MEFRIVDDLIPTLAELNGYDESDFDDEDRNKYVFTPQQKTTVPTIFFKPNWDENIKKLVGYLSRGTTNPEPNVLAKENETPFPISKDVLTAAFTNIDIDAFNSSENDAGAITIGHSYESMLRLYKYTSSLSLPYSITWDRARRETDQLRRIEEAAIRHDWSYCYQIRVSSDQSTNRIEFAPTLKTSPKQTMYDLDEYIYAKADITVASANISTVNLTTLALLIDLQRKTIGETWTMPDPSGILALEIRSYIPADLSLFESLVGIIGETSL